MQTPGLELTLEERLALLHDPKYPLAMKYDPQWQVDNAMGSPCLWLAESLSRVMTFKPGMRVLDMGCGAALTSIFLAKEFGVQVWATDLWVKPTENWKRIRAAGAEDLVYPIHAEAHNLPYANGFFDAIVSFNSFQFFGTANNYLNDHMAHLLRPGGQFGLMVFGLRQEFNGRAPDYLEPHWWPDFYYFHSLDWWRWQLEQTQLFEIEMGDDLDGDGARAALHWEIVMDRMKLIRADQGRNLRWLRLLARRNGAHADDFRV